MCNGKLVSVCGRQRKSEDMHLLQKLDTPLDGLALFLTRVPKQSVTTSSLWVYVGYGPTHGSGPGCFLLSSTQSTLETHMEPTLGATLR